MDFEKIQKLRMRKELILQGLIENSKTTRSLEEELKSVTEDLSRVYFVMGDFDKSLSPTEFQLYKKHFLEGKNLRICSDEIPIEYGYARKLKLKLRSKINNFLKERT